MIDVKQAAKRLATYAKQYSAGAFATPLEKELMLDPSVLRQWGESSNSVLAVTKTLSRDSRKTDYTGRVYVLPKGSKVITHMAATSESLLPKLDEYDYIYAYAEDRRLCSELESQGRVVTATKVSAASEIVHCWGLPGSKWSYEVCDVKTFTQLQNLEAPVDHMVREVQNVDDWYDDFPFYSDGTWSAISLRGYKPDDPQWGVKPSEMPKAWLAQHPEAVDLQLGWTVMASRTPVIRSWVESVTGWENLERVRLFRMTAKPTRNGKLRRHSDIQDKSAGTRNGQLARFHVPLITHPDVKMTCWDLDGQQQRAHMTPGNVYYLDVRKPHAVANNSPVDRVHLVVDVVINNDTRNLITQSQEVASD